MRLRRKITKIIRRDDAVARVGNVAARVNLRFGISNLKFQISERNGGGESDERDERDQRDEKTIAPPRGSPRAGRFRECDAGRRRLIRISACPCHPSASLCRPWACPCHPWASCPFPS